MPMCVPDKEKAIKLARRHFQMIPWQTVFLTPEQHSSRKAHALRELFHVGNLSSAALHNHCFVIMEMPLAFTKYILLGITYQRSIFLLQVSLFVDAVIKYIQNGAGRHKFILCFIECQRRKLSEDMHTISGIAGRAVCLDA